MGDYKELMGGGDDGNLSSAFPVTPMKNAGDVNSPSDAKSAEDETSNSSRAQTPGGESEDTTQAQLSDPDEPPQAKDVERESKNSKKKTSKDRSSSSSKGSVRSSSKKKNRK